MEGLKCQNKEIKSHYEDSCEPVVIFGVNVLFQGGGSGIVVQGGLKGREDSVWRKVRWPPEQSNILSSL